MNEPSYLETFSKIFPFIWCGIFLIFICVAFNAVKVIFAFNKEKKLYAAMINNPSDSTVKAYLTKYHATTTWWANYVNNGRAVEHRNDQLRQSQGWEIVNECGSVSDNTKTLLKNAFIAQGVPIKRMAHK